MKTYAIMIAAAFTLLSFAAGPARADDGSSACSGTVSQCNTYHGS